MQAWFDRIDPFIAGWMDLPEICFTSIPFGLTLEGQYIVKNLVLISAALVVGGTVRAAPVDGRRL